VGESRPTSEEMNDFESLYKARYGEPIDHPIVDCENGLLKARDIQMPIGVNEWKA